MQRNKGKEKVEEIVQATPTQVGGDNNQPTDTSQGTSQPPVADYQDLLIDQNSALQLRSDLKAIDEPKRGWSAFWAGLQGFGLGNAGVLTMTGLGIIFFPVVLGAIGLTAAAFVIAIPAVVVLAPAFIYAGIYARKAYKKQKERHVQEVNGINEFNAKIEKINTAFLTNLTTNIVDSLKFLDIESTKKSVGYSALLANTLVAIDQVRMLTGNNTYAQAEYDKLKQDYQVKNNEEYKPSSSFNFSRPQPKGFFPTIGSDFVGFFKGLNDVRKSNTGGLLKATGQFFSKLIDKSKSFLGGAGIAIAIGGTVATIVGVALTATGVGAIAGIPLLAVTAGILGASVGVGLLTTALDHYYTEKQTERTKHYEKANGVLTKAITTQEDLNTAVEQQKEKAAEQPEVSEIRKQAEAQVKEAKVEAETAQRKVEEAENEKNEMKNANDKMLQIITEKESEIEEGKRNLTGVQSELEKTKDKVITLKKQEKVSEEEKGNLKKEINNLGTVNKQLEDENRQVKLGNDQSRLLIEQLKEQGKTSAEEIRLLREELQKARQEVAGAQKVVVPEKEKKSTVKAEENVNVYSEGGAGEHNVMWANVGNGKKDKEEIKETQEVKETHDNRPV